MFVRKKMLDHKWQMSKFSDTFIIIRKKKDKKIVQIK